MPSPIETWYTDIPPITRIYITASCLTSLAVVSIGNLGQVYSSDNNSIATGPRPSFTTMAQL